MKTAQAGFRFPVVGFTPDLEMWAFQDLDTLTSCGPETLRDNLQIGMELVDADGRRWIVRSVTRTGRAESVLKSLLSMLMFAKPQSRIEHELDALEPLSLEEVKARACAMLEAFPEDYGQYDESDNVLAPLLAEVRRAKDIASLPELLGLDSFKAY
ncbi:MAG: hypothetical protein Q8K11_03440 [Phenylobacterium sp.]|uniref:hypothetical protein n=1 Tax=Phenylobacterium sp. TaxID=1871053 RepID=UPI0027309D43|nr:hypothetical protein [Phenylobacterium sp.]MDP2009211.1 hypothetical protein [Phenylobacterium sp.]